MGFFFVGTLKCVTLASPHKKRYGNGRKKKTAMTSCHTLWETVKRPWGSYVVLEEGPGYLIKKLVVHPGQRTSLQSHTHRSEHWVTVAGAGVFTVGDEDLAAVCSTATIPVGARHRIANPGSENLVIIEVQRGALLSEDDIVRYSDDYGRLE